MKQLFQHGLPLIGSDVAREWDSLYHFLVALSVFFFVLVIGAMLYFAIKYRSSVVKKTKYITHSTLLEWIWIGVPSVLLLVIFTWGYVVYRDMVQAPDNAYEIRVIGKQWLWQFQYDFGKTTVGELVVPMNKPVKLVMTSEDVLHSFFVPNFRVKSDVVPGMYTSVWFEAKVRGIHPVFCTEYCGTSHSGMLAKLIAVTPEEFEAYKKGGKLPPMPFAGERVAASDSPQAAGGGATVARDSMADAGRKHYESKGCVACHSVDGSAKVGPSHKGIYGRKEIVIADGKEKEITVDDNYLRESIETPNAKVVKGFGPVMPTFKGLITETEMNEILAYLKSLK